MGGQCRDAEHCQQGGSCTAGAGPVDVSAVWADDRLLDQVGSGDLVPGTELTRELVPWRRGIHEAGVPVLVSTDEAIAALQSAGVRLPHQRDVSVRHLVASVIAVVLMVGAGLGLAAHGADPGDWLYPLRELLYPARP